MAEDKKLGLFDIVNNITSGTDFLTEPELEAFNPFMINRALSQYRDTVLYANEINMRSQYLDDIMQYAFLFHIIPKKKRFNKWNKNTDDKDLIEKIQKVYGYSYTKAKDVLPLMKAYENVLDTKLHTGGREKLKSKNKV